MRQHHNTATRQPSDMFSDTINFQYCPYIMRCMDTKADLTSSFSFETYKPRPDDEPVKKPSYTFLHAMLILLVTENLVFCLTL